MLLQLHDVARESMFVDATGLTSEDLIERVMEAAGLDTPPERRADWGYALEDSPLSGGLVIIANAQRAGRTRRSTEPERMVHRLTGELALAGVKVLIERDLPDVRRGHDHLVVTLRPDPAGESTERQVLDRVDADALRALALAEPRHAPMDVWERLGLALGSQLGRALDVTAALESAGGLLEVEADGWVRFRDERVAEALRRTIEPDVVRAVNVEVVEWLRDQAMAGATGPYLTQGLAMHAVQAGEFASVQRSGRLVAHLDQVALIDAALSDAPYAIDGESPAGDAVNLWMCGVDSLPQDEWVSWLHLMSTVRGDLRTAADIVASGRHLPWRVRWARWRPPGSLSAEFVRPGPLGRPSVAPEDYCPGRHAVTAPGEWDGRYRVWDAETGEDLAGPWPDAVPAPGQRETLWLPGTERNVTPAWIDLTVFNTLEPPFVSGQVTMGDVVVVTGLGGVFAVEPSGSTAGFEFSRVHGEPMFDDPGFVAALYTRAPQPSGSYDAGLFEPGVVRRLPETRLPEGLTDTESRRILTDIGLPAFEGVEMRLVALDEEGLTEPDPESLPDGTPPGTYYTFGTWVTSDIALHAPTGQVHLLNADDWGSDDEFDDYFDDEDVEDYEVDDDDDDDEVQGSTSLLIAGSLAKFIDLLQHYVMIRCMLATAGSRLERVAIRDALTASLSRIDEAGAAAGAWRAGLTETD
ncbi:SUKH-4 family immunity protein [Streptomyces sp. NPDC046862]|uniref:SUKH-4 family immunity protein n=1 Tax=Streptomyces sp. NPDC046862 TaxID=3154603 RepID=UPI0034518B0F